MITMGMDLPLECVVVYTSSDHTPFVYDHYGCGPTTGVCCGLKSGVPGTGILSSFSNAQVWISFIKELYAKRFFLCIFLQNGWQGLGLTHRVQVEVPLAVGKDVSGNSPGHELKGCWL